MNFTTRFQDLKKENNLTQTAIATKLNTTQQTIGRWLKGENEPDIENIISLANLFGCTVDYLLGREEEDGRILVQSELSAEELKLVNGYNNLNHFARIKLLGYLDGLLANPLVNKSSEA